MPIRTAPVVVKPKRRVTKVASNNPDSMVSTDDVIIELTENRARYDVGNKDGMTVNMVTLPNTVKIGLDVIRRKVEDSRKPSIKLTLACCCVMGCDLLKDVECFNELTKLKNRFSDTSPDESGHTVSLIGDFLSKTTIVVPHGPKYSFPIKKDYASSLAGWADDLGVSQNYLSVISILHTLSIQQSVNRDHRKDMERYVNDFISLMSKKVLGVRAMMTVFELPL